VTSKTEIVFGFGIAQNFALSQLSLCTHDPDRSQHNNFSIFLHFFHPKCPSIFLVITIHQVIWKSLGTLQSYSRELCTTGWPRSLKCLNCGNQKIYFSVKNPGRTSKRFERASCDGRQRLLTAGHPP